jgi:hypothetical protein
MYCQATGYALHVAHKKYPQCTVEALAANVMGLLGTRMALQLAGGAARATW